jgi:SAM-dependent methyltransferase
MGDLEKTVEKWERYYEEVLTASYLFPNEYVVRSFLASYPGLHMDRNYEGKSVCDVSCGDGRNIVLLNKLKLKIFGTEVSENICKVTARKLREHPDHIEADLRPGFNWSLPFDDASFDYTLSWNAIYYMRDERASIGDHIAEFARIMKPGGYLVCSVPTPRCFSLENAVPLSGNLIRLVPGFKWSGRDMLKDMIYYRFDSFEQIEADFGTHFENFSRCLISDDCYGIKLEYFVFVCRKR